MRRSPCAILLAAGLVVASPAETKNSSNDDEPLVTGSGLAYAESCQSQLFAWSSSQISFGSAYGHVSTSIFSSEMSVVSYEPESPTATSLITLCDGHARVVGQWTTHNASSATYNYQWTNSNPVTIPAPYPTPQPCSISPGDCKLLWSSWTSHWNSITLNTPDYTEGLASPPCNTSTAPEPSYSTNADGKQCNNCLIAGNEIRLLYWPVTTVAGSGDLCSKSAETFTAAQTGPPRSLVTEGITITSPTIAISIGGLSRVDDCGTTVPHTIIPVLPEDVTSVEGARALFTHKPFNFADLNYKCLDAPNSDFISTGTRTDCYREVPASAYFLGFQNAAGANWLDPNAFANRTIWPNYQPQVLPPATITSAIRSIWGEDCYIHPNGIWDPPKALQEENSFPLPNAGPAAPTQYYTPQTDVPQPGGPTTPHAPEPTGVGQEGRPTAVAQVHPSPRPSGAGGESSGGEGSHGLSQGSGQGTGVGDHDPADGDSGPENGGQGPDDHTAENSHPSATVGTDANTHNHDDAPNPTTGASPTPSGGSAVDTATAAETTRETATTATSSPADGAVASAIRSGIGGGDEGSQSQEQSPQANAAISMGEKGGRRQLVPLALLLVAAVFALL